MVAVSLCYAGWMNESKDSGQPSPTPDEPVPPAGDSGANTPSSSPARESILDPFADSAARGSVNLDKSAASDSSPAASGVPSGATGGDEGAGGQGSDSEPPEGHSEPQKEDGWEAFLPLGMVFIVLGITMDHMLPFLPVGIIFFTMYLTSGFQNNSKKD